MVNCHSTSNPKDPLGEMRLAQSDTDLDVPGSTTTVTLDLADVHSPYGSVHNRQKQEVGRRVALHALSTGFDIAGINTGPVLNSTQAVGNNTIVHVSTSAAAGSVFNGSHDCVQCCTESSFEASADGVVWQRVVATLGPPLPSGKSVAISLENTAPGTKWVRYGYDALVQCPFFDGDALPLAPFRVPLA
jgi:hypothetical protein